MRPRMNTTGTSSERGNRKRKTFEGIYVYCLIAETLNPQANSAKRSADRGVAGDQLYHTYTGLKGTGPS
jgi:hypothetical protein